MDYLVVKLCKFLLLFSKLSLILLFLGFSKDANKLTFDFINNVNISGRILLILLTSASSNLVIELKTGLHSTNREL